jgi:hypothetical protein
MALHVEAVQLEYAAPRPVLGQEYRSLFRQHLVLAILSGLCVGVCFLSLQAEPIFLPLHLAIFVATIVLAVKTGRSLQVLSGSAAITFNVRFLMDVGALLGLAIIAVAPLGLLVDAEGALKSTGVSCIGLAYGLLAAGSVRHIILYRTLAGIARETSHFRMAKWLKALGYVKTVYEGIWLGCCATTLFLIAFNDSVSLKISDDVLVGFALASLFGAMGFTAIWIWMVVAHALLLRLARTSPLIEPSMLTRPSA